MPSYMSWIMSEIGDESHPQFRRLKMVYMISRKGLLTNKFVEEPEGTSASSKDQPASGKVPDKFKIHTPKETDAEENEDDKIGDTLPQKPPKEEQTKKENLQKSVPKFTPAERSKKRAETELERRERIKKEYQELVQQEFAEAHSDASWMETTSTGLTRQ